MEFGLYSADKKLHLKISYDFGINKSIKYLSLSESERKVNDGKLDSLDNLFGCLCIKKLTRGLDCVLLYPHQEDKNQWEKEMIQDCWKKTGKIIKNNPSISFYVFTFSSDLLKSLEDCVNSKLVFCKDLDDIKHRMDYRLHKKPFGPKEELFNPEDIREFLKKSPFYS